MTSRSALTRSRPASPGRKSRWHGRHPMPTPEPLFSPQDIGMAAPTWEEVLGDAPRCGECGHPLWTEEARRSGIGDCCAAKIGRAVYTSRRLRQLARRFHALAA